MGLVLGVDPGLGHCGWVLAQLEPGPTAITIRDLGVIKTKRSDRKRGVRESDDLLRRVRSFYQQLGDVLRHNEVFAICAESMSWPRNAASTAKIALCWGALAALASERGLPFVQASPQEVKRAMCNRADASKEEVAAAVTKHMPEVESLLRLGRLPAGQHEHAYDAAAVVLACLDSDVVRMARRVA